MTLSRTCSGALAALALSFAMFLVVAPVEVRAATEIKWEDLIPKTTPIPDPLERLTQDQRFDLEMVLWARSLTPEERQLEPNRPGLEDAEKYEKDFAKAGMNVDKLLGEYAAYEEKIKARQKLVNGAMSGKDVRLAGYLLPLEFSEDGETDFLLVPYVGACIHVPPPPPNQIVLIRLAKKFVVKDLYTPVWVEGQLNTKRSSKALTLVDGTKDISIGYHIEGANVEVYKE